LHFAAQIPQVNICVLELAIYLDTGIYHTMHTHAYCVSLIHYPKFLILWCHEGYQAV